MWFNIGLKKKRGQLKNGRELNLCFKQVEHGEDPSFLLNMCFLVDIFNMPSRLVKMVFEISFDTNASKNFLNFNYVMLPISKITEF